MNTRINAVNNILIIDDSAEDRACYKRFLSQSLSQVYAFTEAETIEDGLKCFEALRRLHERQVEKDHLILELQEALSHVKRLSGLLPICASCKSVRDDDGYWQRVEVYIRKHSEASFTHSICPGCAKNIYPVSDRTGTEG